MFTLFQCYLAEIESLNDKTISNPILVNVDLMLCGAQVSEESSLIPHEETNDFSHVRTSS